MANEIISLNDRQITVNDYFKINFDELYENIQKLAEKDIELDPSEIVVATGIVDDWMVRVVGEIRKKQSYMRRFVNTLDPDANRKDKVKHGLDRDELCTLGSTPGCEKAYDDYTAYEDHIDQINREIEDIRQKYNIVGKALYSPENAELYYACQSEIQMKNLELYDINRKRDKAFVKYVSALSNNKNIKAFVKKGKTFLQESDNLIEEATRLGNAARVNLAVKDKNVRETLFQLLDFKIA